jgi:hypothetical protein
MIIHIAVINTIETKGQVIDRYSEKIQYGSMYLMQEMKHFHFYYSCDDISYFLFNELFKRVRARLRVPRPTGTCFLLDAQTAPIMLISFFRRILPVCSGLSRQGMWHGNPANCTGFHLRTHFVRQYKP